MTLARLGQPVALEVEQQCFALSLHEMPGEVDWRIEFLQWLTRKVVFYLTTLPETDVIQSLLRVERELILETGLHSLEAQAVTEAALVEFQNLGEKERKELVEDQARFQQYSMKEWTALTERYAQIVRSQCQSVKAA
ncbi:hypothetical protein V4C53_10325 [Paraburkholderia azotifigens]|uniref:hypothetical protein n=1 Tax=Paraburkholderia azotifigens TaxID=2057004 RepID=UPI00317FDAF4